MVVPKYSEMMLPLLKFASDGKEHHVRDAIQPMVEQFDLSREDQEKLLKNGKETLLNNRIQWAHTYLRKAKLLKTTRRGYIKITERGYDILSQNPSHLDKKYLEQFPEFIEFIKPSKDESDVSDAEDTDSEDTPDEIIDRNYRRLVRDLADQLLESVLSCSPAFFEQLVVDLLLAMGYGSALHEAGQTTHLSNDGGIDGYIQEDKLGLDTVYVQAKRWAIDNSVGRPQIQGFVGSLMGEGATKGVFITTSSFSRGAIEYARNMQNVRLILIDGQQLAQLMIEHDVGVVPKETYTIKQVDENYFID